jgi:hypothetical protein
MFDVFGPLLRPTPSVLPLVLALLPLVGIALRRRAVVVLGVAGLLAAIELAWSMRWPAEERLLLTHLGVAARVGQLDLILALALDPLAALASIAVSAVAARIVLSQRHPRRIALVCALASAMQMVVMADGAATLVLAFGLASIAAATLGRVSVANVVSDRMADASTILAAGILFWALGGSWISDQYVPELEPRVVVAASAPPPHKAAFDDDDDDEMQRNAPKRGARASLSLGSLPGAMVLVDGTWARDRHNVIAPFEGAPIAAGPHTFRVHVGPGSDDFVVPRANAAENDRVQLALHGATTTFRELHDDVVARDAGGQTTGKSALARRRFFGGIAALGWVLALVALGLAARARVFPFASSRDEPARALVALGAVVGLARFALGELAPTSAASCAIALAGCAAISAMVSLRDRDARALLAAEIAFAGAGAIAGASGAAVIHAAIASLLLARRAPGAIAHVAFVPTRIAMIGAFAVLRFGGIAVTVALAFVWLSACALARMHGARERLSIVAAVASFVVAGDPRIVGMTRAPLSQMFDSMSGALASAPAASLPLAALTIGLVAFAWGASRGTALDRLASALAPLAGIQSLAARATSALAVASAAAVFELEARVIAAVSFADRFVRGLGAFASAIDDFVFHRVRLALPIPSDRATRFILVPVALAAAGSFALPWLG